jgi:DNA-binding winged helix-turn-helix (wHTH) protein/Flp pilus assembly protein TadD/TolB-like protein
MPRSVFAFSEFIFDSGTGTLTRRNRESRLPEQTARLLQVLLERPNALVSREEIERALWPDESYVDHDQGINVAINRLRQVLRDNPRNPQFLKTIPKRGYSFCGDVRVQALESKDESSIEKQAFSMPNPAALIPAAGLVSLLQADAAASREEEAPDWKQPSAGVLIPSQGSHSTSSSRSRRKVVTLALIAAVLVTAAVGLALWRKSKSISGAPRSLRIGIAPLRVGDDPQTRETSESFRLQLSDAVSRLPGVQVPAAGAFVSARPEDIPRIARDLNLDDLLLGSISRQQDQYDLKFELVRATDATHLDSFEFSGPKKDLPAISEMLQQDIFHYMQINSALLQSSKGSTNDAQAYEYYLQGQFYMLERNPESLRRSLEEFAKATARDPGFALAYAGAATAYLKLSEYDTDPANGLLSKAEEYAQKAVRQDVLLPQAHAVLGVTAYKQDRNFTRGEAELREAIRIDPTQAAYRNWLAVLLVQEGRFDESIEELNKAENNDPYWPSVYAMQGLAGVYARRDSYAIKAAKHYVEVLPNLPVAHNTMAWVYFDTRHYEDAIREWREMALLQSDSARVDLETRGLAVFRSKGVHAYALLRLDAIHQKRGIAQVNDFMLAEWYACAGKREQTLNELDHLVAQRDPFILHIGVDPLYDSFHEDPRFLAILAKSGLSIPPSLKNVNSHLCEMKASL